MPSSEYRRGIERYLRDTYGVTAIESLPGTNHARLAFEYGGERRVLTLHRNQERTSTNILTMKKQDIRRLLGPPLVVEREIEMKTTPTVSAIYTPGLNAQRAAVSLATREKWTVGIALYRNGSSGSLRFLLSLDLVNAFGPGKCVVEPLGPEDWKIVKSEMGIEPRKWIGSKDSVVTHTLVPIGNVEPFGRTEAEATIVDGVILVHLPVEGRAKMKVSQKGKRIVASTAQAPVQFADELHVAHAAQAPVQFADELHVALEEIRRLQAKYPFCRLIKESSTGELMWVIK